MIMTLLCLPFVWMLWIARLRRVSAPAVLGIYPHTVFELAKRIIPSEKVASISIAEMNPQYDLDNRTAKLVANLVHHFLI